MPRKSSQKKSVIETKVQVAHEAIAGLARQLWENEGRPMGRDLDYWLRAERELLAVGVAGGPASAGNATP